MYGGVSINFLVILFCLLLHCFRVQFDGSLEFATPCNYPLWFFKLAKAYLNFATVWFKTQQYKKTDQEKRKFVFTLGALYLTCSFSWQMNESRARSKTRTIKMLF